MRPRLREFRLIEDLRRRFGHAGPAVLRGIGDDAALIQPKPGHHLLLTTDLLAEGIHFDLATATFEEIGYKAAVANLSDIAAMGGTPHALLVSLAVPARRRPAEILQLYRGLMQACRPHNVDLVGGDTAASECGLFLSITMTGSVKPGRALRRDGARVGDRVYVTGTLGDSLAGLSLLNAARATRISRNDARALINRHVRPVSRLQAGQLLSARQLATAAIDISDGLSGDLRHLCEQSGVGVEIEAGTLPLSKALRSYAAATRLDPVRLALHGGEDYELLFTVPARKRTALDRLAHRMGCRLTPIGTIRPKGFGLQLRSTRGTLQPLRNASYQHFQSTL